MSARKSPTLVNLNPSSLRSPQARIPVSGSEGQQCAAHSENGRFQLAQLWRLTNTLIKVRKGGPLEVLKMKVDPVMCMKTQATMTKCPVKNTAFYRKMRQLSGNRQESK
jgi:hypothetical protein